MLYVWIAAIAVFVVLELLTPQLICIWFAIGSVSALVAEKLGASEWVQFAIFAGVSLVALIITRPLYNKYVKSNTVATNSDRLIGMEAVVTEDIDNMEAKGSVKVAGQIWSAKSTKGLPIKKESIVIVDSIEGVKLSVTEK
ncbi:MAG: NfeD family protein [Ruminococcaceae bacterium]|nr:NfeD family protein [Oscillospiraceae bacterium]